MAGRNSCCSELQCMGSDLTTRAMLSRLYPPKDSEMIEESVVRLWKSDDGALITENSVAFQMALGWALHGPPCDGDFLSFRPGRRGGATVNPPARCQEFDSAEPHLRRRRFGMRIAPSTPHTNHRRSARLFTDNSIFPPAHETDREAARQPFLPITIAAQVHQHAIRHSIDMPYQLTVFLEYHDRRAHADRRYIWTDTSRSGCECFSHSTSSIVCSFIRNELIRRCPVIGRNP